MNRHHSSFPRGITIPDALIAGTIMLLAIVALYQGLVASYRASHKARLEVQANYAAVSRLETVMELAYRDIASYCVTDSLARIYTMKVSYLTNCLNNAKLVNLDVKWKFDNRWISNQYTMLKAAEIDMNGAGPNL